MCDVVPPEIYAVSLASCFSKKGRDKVCESNVLTKMFWDMFYSTTVHCDFTCHLKGDYTMNEEEIYVQVIARHQLK